MKTILAIIGGLWVVGRLSRLSDGHPLKAIRIKIATTQGAAQPYPFHGPAEETAQISGGFVVGEGGGEG